MSSRARVVTLLLASALAASSCAAQTSPDLEVISRVPGFVLTVEDLRARIQRAPRELGVQTAGVRVHGILTLRGELCSPAPGARVADPRCGADRKKRHRFGDPGGAEISLVLVDGVPVVEGRHYVLDGEVELAPDEPERWLFRGRVLAEVR